MRSFAIAGLQLELAAGDNLAAIEAEVRSAKKRFPWLDLIMVGELAAFGPGTEHAQALPGAAEQHFCRVARELGVWLLPGTMYERTPQGIHNTASMIDPDGKVVTRYRKIYPFLPYERGVLSGNAPVVFDIPGVGRFGLSICYDMWFPETTRALVWQGAEVILHPTMTNTIDRDAELSIARASAATNQCYFIDINVAGRLGHGRSCAYGPGGEVLHVAGTTREFIVLNVDLEHVRDVRERGWNGLCQTLKSFRDTEIDYPQYSRARADQSALRQLGPLVLPASRPKAT